VRELRAQGQVVGFLGDGINDAPALRAADIGISVDSAVDIAKEAADIILLERT
jgi:Mg2+-importing ATPase